MTASPHDPPSVARPAKAARRAAQSAPKRRAAPSTPAVAPQAFAHATVLDEARAAGLLDGHKSEHVSFRVPPALLAAARREAGIASVTELGLLALALLAQPDPVVAAMRRNRGRLGASHQLEY